MHLRIAIRAWNMMNNCIDWNALPVVVQFIGVDDVEQLISDLESIKEFNYGRNSD